MGQELYPPPSSPSASLLALEKGCLFHSKKDLSSSPSSGSLGNSGSLPPLALTDEARKRRNHRYYLMKLLAGAVRSRKLLKHQVRFCSCAPVPADVRKKDGEKVQTGMSGKIEIHRREESHHYYGMQRCGSALVCPVCSMILQVRRAQEVVTAGSYLLAHGFRVGMVTQTASHSAATSLVDFVARFQAAQHDMKKTRAYQTWKKRHGMRFTIRAVEITDDHPLYDFKTEGRRRSGWHFHSHTLLFFEREAHFTPEEVEAFTVEFQALWVKALEGVGLSGSLERAAVFSVPEGASRADGEAALSRYVAKGFGWEVSGGRMKQGKDGDRRISAWGLQELALTTKPELLPRYSRYMEAVKGLSWLRWSQGLKAFCGLDELADEDLLRGEAGEEQVWAFEDGDFLSIVKQAAQGKLLDVADVEGREGIARAMKAASLGFDIQTGEEIELAKEDRRTAIARDLYKKGVLL